MVLLALTFRIHIIFRTQTKTGYSKYRTERGLGIFFAFIMRRSNRRKNKRRILL